MSTKRLVGTSAAMALLAIALGALTPDFAELTAALASAQRTADTLGPDALVAAAAGLLAWAVWAWGAVGLLLTAGAALPGLLGAVSRVLLHVVVPAGARRSAALVLGVGVGVAAPLLPALPGAGSPGVAMAAPAAPVPDWPTETPTGTPSEAAAPDWPAQTGGARHVVVRGDCLWHLAAGDLRAGQDRAPTEAEIATAVHAWWSANADVIGPDPDLLLPGQVLQLPTSPEELP